MQDLYEGRKWAGKIDRLDWGVEKQSKSWLESNEIHYKTTICLDFIFEINQFLRFEVWDHDDGALD